MPPKKTKNNKSIPVMAHKHKDKRANIPTKELRDFVEDQEKNPKIVLYPRDPLLAAAVASSSKSATKTSTSCARV